MAVAELKGFLQTHLREKNSTELSQELTCTKQDENETPQQFLYCLIGLKPCILLTSKLADTNITYSTATVQDVFLHTVYQGLGHKHTDICRELKPLLTNSGVTDEMILRHVMKITSEENERMKRLDSSRRQTVTNAHSAQLESDLVNTPSTKSESVGSKTKQTKPDRLRDLMTKVEELTRLVETMQKQNQQQLTHNGHQYSQNRAQSKRGKPYGCPSCIKQDRQDCKHYFTCGEEGHRAAGCLKRPKRQGNSNRALERDIYQVDNDKIRYSPPSTSVTTSTLSHCNQVAQLPPQSPCVAKARAFASLIGKKALVQGYLNGLAVTSLLDSGSQVSIVSRAWKEEYLPDLSIHPVSEILGEEELKVTAANGSLSPYDGWVAMTVNLPGN
ncbi:hypothetical protein Q7C36_003336 [Tachysurus vachellii]|uniref:CCHC-type domain-containing protein n=1 Tax=Tachysurus vachellii TaxID=175792 RepID=A0AA88NPS0_TACVA|nr:hypothetical protein Q7C36_003336 [Tachysurus vachellii]